MTNEWILSSSLLIAAVLLGRRLLRGKISLRLQYALWGLVLLRLLLPVQLFTSAYGVGTVAREVDISEPIRQVYISANEDRYELAYDEAYQWAAEAYSKNGQTVDPMAIEKTARDMAQADLEVDLKGLLTNIWLGGMAVMTAVIVFCNLHLSRQLKRRSWEYPVPGCLLPVYVTGAVPTPCIFGLFRPVIYLTPEAAKDEQIRRHVLAHEQTHYRHGDHLWSVLRSVCLVLHWYNPLVWIAVKASKIDAELACDEGVLARLGESHRGDYGRTLIGLTCSAPLSDYLLTATTMTGSAGSIRQRIKLLMARPRNTLLALIAVILIGTLVVGCSFAGAPETTPPATEPSEPARDTLGLVNGDGILVFPGTRWNMTREEVLAALELTESDLDSFDNYQFTIPEYAFLGQNVEITFCFNRYSQANHFGFDSVMITFDSQEAADAVCTILKDALGAPLSENSDIGSYIWHSPTKLDALISGEAFEFWLTDYTGLKQEGENSTIHSIPASTLMMSGADFPEEGIQATLIFGSYLTIAQQIEQVLGTDPVAEVTALFGEDPDPWYLAALNVLYHDPLYLDAVDFFAGAQTDAALTAQEQALIVKHYGEEALEKSIFRMTSDQMDQIVQTYLHTADLWCLNLNGFLYCPETDAYLDVREEPAPLQSPEIISCELLDTNQVRMVYQFPEKTQRYVANFYRKATWAVESNQLLIQQPIHAQVLTPEQIEQVNAAYDTYARDENGEPYRLSDVSGLFNCIFSDPAGIDLSQMIAYYPTYADASQTEWELLKQKYDEDLPFSHETRVEDVGVPVHRYDADYLDRALRRYTGIGLADLAKKPLRYHLEETNAYYNFTSDANPGMFVCQGGWIQEDGTVVLYARNTVLLLSERKGSYFIRSHLPATVVFPPSSSPMIPASDPRDAEITALVTAFNRAYQENLYMGTDNPYDHLTVLAVDPEITVTHQGQTIPLSDFYRNIEYLHDKETWFHHTRSREDGNREEYAISCQVDRILYDDGGDTAIVVTSGGVVFADDDPAAPSGEGAIHKFLLVNVNGIWLVADVLADGEGFDLKYKDNPTFDVEKMIAERFPG